MTESWTNSKGVKFIGDNQSVPAPDYKGANVVDYKEWHEKETEEDLNLSIELTSTDAISESAAGSGIQIVSINTRMLSNGAPYPAWNNNFNFTITTDETGGEVSLGAQIPNNNFIVQDLEVGSNILEGQNIVVTATSSDAFETYTETFTFVIVA